MEYDREEEFEASRSRHPMKIHLKTGVKKDGTITANECTRCLIQARMAATRLTVTGNYRSKINGLVL
jgi:putative selenate reductase molybdopterin-binding subunit